MADLLRFTQDLLEDADVKINGRRPWDLQVHNDKLFQRFFARGSLALGETYVEGWWDVSRLDEFFERVLRAGLEDRIKTVKGLVQLARARLRNLQTPSRSFEVGLRHYDIGNDLYERMLDSYMCYSCGYWETAQTLEQAQQAKLDLICRKIGLKAGHRVLDIGCGWGGFAKFAAEHYGAEVVGVTISREQAGLAMQRCSGLPVEIHIADYRSIDEKFDRIVSIGMFEHVGRKNFDNYMRVARRCLKESGLLLLHTIGKNRPDTVTDPWIDHYIFPNGDLPTLQQITKACESRFIIEDVHNFGAYYDHTLMAWFHNFEGAWESLRDQYDDRFYRTWKYYLLLCAGAFRARDLQLWQVVLAPNGVVGGYQRVS